MQIPKHNRNLCAASQPRGRPARSSSRDLLPSLPFSPMIAMLSMTNGLLGGKTQYEYTVMTHLVPTRACFVTQGHYIISWAMSKLDDLRRSEAEDDQLSRSLALLRCRLDDDGPDPTSAFFQYSASTRSIAGCTHRIPAWALFDTREKPSPLRSAARTILPLQSAAVHRQQPSKLLRPPVKCVA
jgi:hypothetical protein